MKRIFKYNAQIDGRMVAEGTIINVSEERMKQEAELGKHPVTGRPLSAILAHTEPLDGEPELQPLPKVRALSETVPVSQDAAKKMADEAAKKAVEDYKAEQGKGSAEGSGEPETQEAPAPEKKKPGRKKKG